MSDTFAGQSDEKAGSVEGGDSRMGRNYTQVGRDKDKKTRHPNFTNVTIDRSHQRRGICKEAYRACEQVCQSHLESELQNIRAYILKVKGLRILPFSLKKFAEKAP